jgi:hypothetical protein
MSYRLSFVLPLFLASAGCLAPQPGTASVPSNPFGISPSGQKALASRAQASVETAARVDGIGRKILAANPQAGFGVQSPQIRTIGVPQPEIFHIGTTEIDITEGLAKQCTTEGQLAAVLCMELGKMVSEREAFTAPQTRAPERQPPMEVRIGNDNAGSFGPADQMHRAELAKYDDERQRQKAARVPPNPQILAGSYLKNAGYSEGELEAVSPLLRSAAESATMANQLTPVAPNQSSGR